MLPHWSVKLCWLKCFLKRCPWAKPTPIALCPQPVSLTQNFFATLCLTCLTMRFISWLFHIYFFVFTHVTRLMSLCQLKVERSALENWGWVSRDIRRIGRFVWVCGQYFIFLLGFLFILLVFFLSVFKNSALSSKRSSSKSCDFAE